MNKKITSALISVFYKDGLDIIAKQLQKQGATIYSTGGTQAYLEKLGIEVVPVEDLTSYPSILGGRVKTLHPSVFGGILGRRSNQQDLQEMKEYKIPVIDLVIVDLYPFEETLAATRSASFKGTAEEAEKQVIEKIDIGGPSMIRAAAKNFADVAVIASKEEYAPVADLLQKQNGEITLEQRRELASKAFAIVSDYDMAITNYFHPGSPVRVVGSGPAKSLRYGENPHQSATFYGRLEECFKQLHGKEISYNNLVDIDAAIELIREFSGKTPSPEAVFAVIKHTNVCGIAQRTTVEQAWKSALSSDSESAFGGVLVCNKEIDAATANGINEIFFEVLMAPSFSGDALQILKGKKNRILLQLEQLPATHEVYKSVVNGTLVQQKDEGNYEKWEEVGGRPTTAEEKDNLVFANIICKHLKSNAIALIKDMQLVGKGCGQTSRIDALRQAVEKARQFNFELKGAVMASDAFFPFNDCVQLGYEAGITAFIQPGGSIRDKDSIEYAKQKKLAMVLTGTRHFRH
jgi:phosphoribosylaminoimidazolecarboxamide formyltransferase / IMP cyclohydrolase